ncbi:FAD:protein FMN transferase [Thioclava sp. FR2]|uniref:FAD:protein FMN transferase n=1 Tax=Thioclava sp. FR2 TaxID=3445780 RepID=UPI003EC12313
MKRRRFLQILASTAVMGRPSQAGQDWSGQGFGADLSLKLAGNGDRKTVLSELPALIKKIEAEFSLYDPASSLSKLNREGSLTPSPMFLDLLDRIETIHALTGGIFDPTVQGIWQQRTGQISTPIIGWGHLRLSSGSLILPPTCALTFNGIAQGYAADCVKRLLLDNGYTKALVDLGEQYALGGPWTIGVADPSHGQLATYKLSNIAIATSSPQATMVAGFQHLINPTGSSPLWSTVSVEAREAVLADGISTAAVFMPIADLNALMERAPSVRRITLVDFDGSLRTLKS